MAASIRSIRAWPPIIGASRISVLRVSVATSPPGSRATVSMIAAAMAALAAPTATAVSTRMCAGERSPCSSSISLNNCRLAPRAPTVTASSTTATAMLKAPNRVAP